MAQPDAEQFLHAVDASDVQKTISVRYRIISDIDFNPITQIDRPREQSGLFSNALNEKRKSESFEKQCELLLAKKEPIEGEAHSSIFQPIVTELEYLTSLPSGHKKHLIIYSDLHEKCQWLSVYKYSDMKLLERSHGGSRQILYL